MQYGYFDNDKREYIITDPRTPMPWANYLGSPEYGAIVTQNAGGYSFVKSGAAGRILRYTFNQFVEPGRYIYLRDESTGDFWSASWRPVEKPLEQYHTVTRHGTAYTQIESEYSDIASQVLYYVPLDATHEVWLLTVANKSDRSRRLTLTGYAEFTNHPNYEQDQVNLQYSLFIGRTYFDKNRVVHQVHGNLADIEKDKKVDEKNVTERVLGLAGSPVSSYCGDKEEFHSRRQARHARRRGSPHPQTGRAEARSTRLIPRDEQERQFLYRSPFCGKGRGQLQGGTAQREHHSGEDRRYSQRPPAGQEGPGFPSQAFLSRAEIGEGGCGNLG